MFAIRNWSWSWLGVQALLSALRCGGVTSRLALESWIDHQRNDCVGESCDLRGMGEERAITLPTLMGNVENLQSKRMEAILHQLRHKRRSLHCAPRTRYTLVLSSERSVSCARYPVWQNSATSASASSAACSACWPHGSWARMVGLERGRQAVCLVRLPVLAHRVGCHGRDGRHRGVSGHAVLTRSRQFGRFDRVTL